MTLPRIITMNTKITSIRLDNDLRNKAEQVVDRTGLDMTSVLRFCIKSAMDLSMTASEKPGEFTPEEFKTPEFDFLVSAHRMKSREEE